MPVFVIYSENFGLIFFVDSIIFEEFWSNFRDYLKKINFKGKYIPVNKDDNPAKIVLQSRYGSELWRYFAVIALMLALAEMTLARNTKRELGTVNS